MQDKSAFFTLSRHTFVTLIMVTLLFVIMISYNIACAESITEEEELPYSRNAVAA